MDINEYFSNDEECIYLTTSLQPVMFMEAWEIEDECEEDEEDK